MYNLFDHEVTHTV
ncbi:hypothetical protein DPMN_123173 [Dreissena polymorpha]|uniref:Uncharacterized protein n=1 Tax=Dreissena polymorpha TaxID=45954 RepID=A0A9D4GQC9_DREPO|nr:hypothetical protein DPMN_123173 [Dreissena polymorpha]